MFVDLPKVLGTYRHNVLMSKTTWAGIGGNADVVFKPCNVNDLIDFIKCNELPISVIGATSNIVVGDNGIGGITIRLGREFAYIREHYNSIIAGGATLLSSLAYFTAKQQLSGFEFLLGIPGTVGGGIEMNAGAYNSAIASIVRRIRAVNLKSGDLCVFSNEDMKYFYRGHNLNERWVFVEAEFQGVKSEYTSILQTMKKMAEQRERSQPTTGKTTGCMFKNHKDYKVWELIDKSGCRGLSVGGAKMSEKHCNFMINYNNATASDVKNLGEKIQKIVRSKFNTDLEWEIRFL